MFCIVETIVNLAYNMDKELRLCLKLGCQFKKDLWKKEKE